MSIFESVTTNIQGVPEVSCEEFNQKRDQVELIDVRRADEFTGELGHIPGARLVTLETDWEAEVKKLDPNKTYVINCRSGQRSSAATQMALDAGIKQVFNLEGGMLKWNALGFEIEK